MFKKVYVFLDEEKCLKETDASFQTKLSEFSIPQDSTRFHKYSTIKNRTKKKKKKKIKQIKIEQAKRIKRKTLSNKSGLAKKKKLLVERNPVNKFIFIVTHKEK